MNKLAVVLLSIIISSFITVVVFFSILKTSLGVTGSLVAVLLAYFGFSFLKKTSLIDIFTGIDVNLVQTATSAAGSISASSLFLIAYYVSGNILTLSQLILFLIISGMLGVCFAIPLRYYFIINEGLPFPSGTACYNINISLLDKSKRNSIGKWLGAGLFVGAIQKAAIIFNYMKAYLLAPTIFGLPLQRLLIGISTEPLLIGIGLIIGARVALTLGVGSLVIWGAIVPFLNEISVIDQASFGAAKSLMVYAAISWLVTAGGIQLLVSIIQSTNTKTKDSKKNEQLLWIIPFRFWVLLIAILLLLEILILNWIGIPFTMSIVAVVGSLFFAFVSIKCLGATDMNPLSTLSNLMLFIQAKLGSVIPVLPASATTVIASLSSDTMQDYKTGYLLKANAMRQTMMQIGGVITGSLVLAYLFHSLIATGIIVPGNGEYPAPTSMAVAELSNVLSQKASIPPHAMMISLIFGFIAAIVTAFELKIKTKWAPSSLALGVAMILPPFYAIGIAAGGLIGSLLLSFKSGWEAPVALGTGFILADSLLGFLSLMVK